MSVVLPNAQARKQKTSANDKLPRGLPVGTPWHLPQLTGHERRWVATWLEDFKYLRPAEPCLMTEVGGWDEAAYELLGLIAWTVHSQLAGRLGMCPSVRQYEMRLQQFPEYRRGRREQGAVWLPQRLAKRRVALLRTDVVRRPSYLPSRICNRTAEWLSQIRYLLAVVPERMTQAFGWDEAATRVAELLFSTVRWLAAELRRTGRLTE